MQLLVQEALEVVRVTWNHVGLAPNIKGPAQHPHPQCRGSSPNWKSMVGPHSQNVYIRLSHMWTSTQVDENYSTRGRATRLFVLYEYRFCSLVPVLFSLAMVHGSSKKLRTGMYM